MNIKFIIIGMFFLLNPQINIIDILPDFVGYAFIIKGLSKYSFICDDFKITYSSIKYLLVISALKIPCLAAVFAASGSNQVWLLLLAVCFGIFEVFFGMRAMGGLFDGLAYCAMRTNDDVSEDKSAVFNGIDFMRAFSIAFVWLKTLLCILPELTLLSSENFGEVTVDGIFSWVRYRPYFIVAAFIIVLAVGIYWFVRIYKYFKGIEKDSTYLSLLQERFERISRENASEVMKKRLYFVFSMLIFGFVGLISFNADGFDYVPRVLGGIFFAAALYALIPMLGDACKKLYKFAIIYTVASGVVWIYQFSFVMSFFKNQLFSDDLGLAVAYSYALTHMLERDFTTIYLYIGSIILAIAEALLMFFFIRKLKPILESFIASHTGVTGMRGDNDTTIAETKAIQKSLNSHLFVMTVFGMIAAFCPALNVITSTFFPAFWLVDYAVRIVFIILAVVLVNRIKEAVKTKYYIE